MTAAWRLAASPDVGALSVTEGKGNVPNKPSIRLGAAASGFLTDALIRAAASHSTITSNLCREAEPLGKYWDLRRAHHQRLLGSGGDVYTNSTKGSSVKYTAGKFSGAEWFAAADWLATRIALSRELGNTPDDIEQVIALVIFERPQQLQYFADAGVC